MHERPRLDYVSSQHHSRHNKGQSHFRVTKNPWKRQQWQRENWARVERPEHADSAPDSPGKSGHRRTLLETFPLEVEIEVAHFRVTVVGFGARLLPDEIRGNRVCLAVDGIGHHDRVPGDAPKVVAH